jgi:GNAT superfamily N-acetyltransferase
LFIRKALNHEFRLIREQRILAYKEYAEKLPKYHWLALKEAILADSDTQPGVEILVAEADGEIIGSVVLFPGKIDAYKGQTEILDYPEIRMLSVMPHARKKGVAIALIKECIERSKIMNAKFIGLHTGEFMDNAMKLYERMGFERVPELDFTPSDDGIVVKGYRFSII